MSRLHVGDMKRVTGTFKNAAGVGTNPSTASLVIDKPDKTRLTVVPTADGSGVYHYDISLDQHGIWEYAFIGTGTVTAAEPKRFTVLWSRVLVPA